MKTKTKEKAVVQRLITKTFKLVCPNCRNNKRFINLSKNSTYRSKCTRCGYKW